MGIAFGLVLLLGELDPALVAMAIAIVLGSLAFGIAHLTSFVVGQEGNIVVRWFPPTRTLGVERIDRVESRVDGVLLRTPVLVLEGGQRVAVMALTSYPSRVEERMEALRQLIESTRLGAT